MAAFCTNMGGLHNYAFLATAKDDRNYIYLAPTTAWLPAALSTKLHTFNAHSIFSAYIGKGLYIHVVQQVEWISVVDAESVLGELQCWAVSTRVDRVWWGNSEWEGQLKSCKCLVLNVFKRECLRGIWWVAGSTRNVATITFLHVSVFYGRYVTYIECRLPVA